VRVTLWYFADCPNWRLAEQRLRQALAGLGRADADLSLVSVETEAEAAAVGFGGSPTFTVDGVDLFAAEAPAGAWSAGYTARRSVWPARPRSQTWSPPSPRRCRHDASHREH
jgi:hypothetical protein